MNDSLKIKVHIMFTQDNLETPHFEFCKKFNLEYGVLTRNHFSQVNTHCLNNRIPFELIAPGKERYYFTHPENFGVYNICLYSHQPVNEKNLVTLLKCLTMGQDHAMVLEKKQSQGLYAYVKNGYITFDPKDKEEYCVTAYGFRKKASNIPPLFESALKKQAFSAQKVSWIFND